MSSRFNGISTADETSKIDKSERKPSIADKNNIKGLSIAQNNKGLRAEHTAKRKENKSKMTISMRGSYAQDKIKMRGRW